MSSVPSDSDSDVEVSFTSPVLGTYIDGYKITADTLSEASVRIRRWLDQHLVVVLRGPSLQATEQRDLVLEFGPLFQHHHINGRQLLQCE